ncbi:hypothetical protein ACWC9Q_37085, partial [Streptomyces sp. NPDC001142]
MTTPTRQPLPDPRTLTWDQANGRACIWCGQILTTSTIRVGIIHDRLGAHMAVGGDIREAAPAGEVFPPPPGAVPRPFTRPSRSTRPRRHQGKAEK